LKINVFDVNKIESSEIPYLWRMNVRKLKEPEISEIFNDFIAEYTTVETDIVSFAKTRQISTIKLKRYIDTTEAAKIEFEAANEIQADILVAAATRIADEQMSERPDLFTGKMPKGDANRARLQIEVRLKRAAALCPWKYGSKERATVVSQSERPQMRLPDGSMMEI
jgi:DNA primase large subunit